MDKDHNKYKKLIELFYRGKTRGEQELDLLQKIKTDSQIKKEFMDYNDSYYPFTLVGKETEISWNKFRESNINGVAKPSGQIRNIVLKVAGYAAVFVLGLFAFYLTDNIFKREEVASAYFETYVPKGQKSQLTLPDGSKIWMNSESLLKYPTSFNSDTRTVELSGEAYFKVAHNQEIPFVVKTNDYLTRVHGTEFNIMAYPDFNRTETTLINGSVEILEASGNDAQSLVTLVPGEKLSWSKSNRSIHISQANTEQVTAWKNNEFVFIDIPFFELAKRLERWYDVSIAFADPELNKIKYTGKFRNEETIWQVLDIIKTTTPIEYNLKHRKLTIKKRRKLMK